ncbi:MAG: preprotein translocase subunit SecE [Sandaracinaceae bacterium]|jgi:preprotein translocase subunit SecE|nr:preprotein translocase subunit SecE [Sandaracinaceae bacterium]
MDADQHNDEPNEKSLDEESQEASAQDLSNEEIAASNVSIASAFGVERYVQGAFLLAAGLFVWIINKTGVLVWNQFGEPNTSIVIGAAIVLGAFGAFLLYRNEKVNRLAHEVGTELSKVSWPTRAETSTSTVVVIVFSVVAAIAMGVFDSVWSAVTDLIYGTTKG